MTATETLGRELINHWSEGVAMPSWRMDEQDEPSLAGMTINERLFHVGILNKWKAAVRRRDRQEMIALLEQVEVTDPQLTVDTVLTDPQAYGF